MDLENGEQTAAQPDIGQNVVQTDTPQPLDFSQAVMAALNARKVNSRCAGCVAFGWGIFHLHPAPVVTPTAINGVVILSACLICTKCGAMRLFNLNALGLNVQMEQPRIITPAQAQAAGPLIVAG
jgi:hypothetical protein